jgi:integrase
MPNKQRERRRRGEGGIYPIRKNDKIVRYAAAVDLGTIDGKRRRKVVYGETEMEVAAELTKLRADLLRGIDIAPERMTIEQYLAAWLKSVELTKSAGTLRIHRTNAKHIVRYIGSHTLQGLKVEHVEAMMSDLRDTGLAEGTRKAIRATLVAALNQAVERGYVAKNVAKLVKAPRVRKAKAKAFTEAQLNRLFTVARGHYLEPMIQIGARLGWRSGEVRGLLWADIDFDEQTIRISGAMKTIDRKRVRESTKTEDSETVQPLAPGLVKVLKARWEQQQQDRENAGKDWEQNGLVFTNDHGRAIDGTTLAQAFKVLVRHANLPPQATYHWLRHTCAALLIKRGARERKVMEVLRHKSIRTTMDVYGHMFPENVRETVSELDRDLDQLAAGGGA